MDIVLGPVRGAHFPAEVLIIGLHLADVGTRACRVGRAGDGGELYLIQVVVPIGSHVPRGTEQPEAEESTVTYKPSQLSCILQSGKASVIFLSHSVTSIHTVDSTCNALCPLTTKGSQDSPMTLPRDGPLLYPTRW